MTSHARAEAHHDAPAAPLVITHDCAEHSVIPCITDAFYRFVKTFSKVYAARTCLAVLMRALSLLRKQPRSVLSLTMLVGEKHLKIREEAVRLGLFIGLFSSGYRLFKCLLARYWRRDDKTNTIAAGLIAGLAVCTQPTETRRTLALYVGVRLVQSTYNDLKARGIIKALPYGDALIFAVGSAQVMYSWLMNTDTLPKSYTKFITKTGPIHEVVLSTARLNCENKPFDSRLPGYLAKFAPVNGVAREIACCGEPIPDIIGCNIIHPMDPSCLSRFAFVFYDTARKILPLYSSISILPTLLFRFKTVRRDPLRQIGKLLFATAQSTSFLAAFVSLYQLGVCLHRNLYAMGYVGNSAYVFFWCGLLSGASIFIERPSRRSELALYVLPRAADSLFMIMRDRGVIPSLRYGEVLVFAGAIAGLMHFMREAPDTVHPLVQTIVRRIFALSD